MSRLPVAYAAFVLALLTTGARADSLPLPDNLTGFSTPVTVALTSAGGATLPAGVGAITATAGSNSNPLSPPAVRIAAPPAGGLSGL